MKHRPILRLLLFITLLLPGCLKREVAISIEADGSCRVRVVFAGGKDDLYSGCLLPDKANWTVKEYTKQDEKGRKTYFYEATARFKSANDIPSSFAIEKTKYPDAYLHTPVELKVRKEAGKTIYEFRQTYKGRRWVDLEEKQVELIDFDVLLKVKKEGVNSLTDEEKRLLYKGMVELEKWKMADRIERAISRVAGELGITDEQTAKLVGVIKSYLDETITQKVIDELLEIAESQKQKREDEIKGKIHKGINLRITETLGIKKTGNAYKRIEDSINFVEKDDEITEDLSDESFNITVRMPGAITETNATTIEGVKNNLARWEFSGEELCGDDIVINIVSILEK